ncbi:glycosyltransferase family 39 protein [Paucibacter sp. B2R-40]|uniref:glycosyltransferase family 39 protein n=1 Tax=Paucibacter sp. B2R-40 TaxID=2893554 RepID=UPI0021E4AFF9|nr:glycosyltransferase family 39 protein [Paucibacter sp. B2R-40]MCV2353241.1 glycosyltransferase family 39 protein [Paucibacter sp. B2R-40]
MSKTYSLLDPFTRSSTALAQRLRAVPVAAWLALWALTWLTLLWLSSSSPPVDNAEQLSWVRSLEWGYYKHPPLPTALLWPLVQLLGLHEWVSYLAAGAVTGLALLCSHRLVQELLGKQRANLALLGTLCIGFYTQRLSYFNHDVALLLCVAAAAACCWRAFAHRSWRAWIALGLLLGLGALAKYEVALAGASVLAVWAQHQGWRDRLHRRGLIAAIAVALLVFSPHVYWLITHDLQPLTYLRQNGMASALSLPQCAVGALRWIGNQFTQMAGALILGAGLLWRSHKGAGAPSAAEDSPQAVAREASARWFLTNWGLLPLVLMPLIAMSLRGSMHLNWGSAFMPLTCAALMAQLSGRRWQAIRLRDALLGFVLVQMLGIACLLISSKHSDHVLNQDRSRTFASQYVADQIGPAARKLLGGDIHIIAGPQRLASVLALRLPERPLVLIDGQYTLSPWVPADLDHECGILWVGLKGSEPPFNAERHDIGEGLWWAVERLNSDTYCH